MTALYEITGELKTTLQILESMDLDEQTIKDTLEGVELEFDEKVISIAKFIKNLESTAEAIKQAETEMSKRRKSLENKVMKMKDYVLTNMQTVEKTKVQSPFFDVSIRKNPASVLVEDIDLIPAKYFVMPEVEPQLDKKAIKDAIESGEAVKGASIHNTISLQIK